MCGTLSNIFPSPMRRLISLFNTRHIEKGSKVFLKCEYEAEAVSYDEILTLILLVPGFEEQPVRTGIAPLPGRRLGFSLDNKGRIYKKVKKTLDKAQEIYYECPGRGVSPSEG